VLSSPPSVLNDLGSHEGRWYLINRAASTERITPTNANGEASRPNSRHACRRRPSRIGGAGARPSIGRHIHALLIGGCGVKVHCHTPRQSQHYHRQLRRIQQPASRTRYAARRRRIRTTESVTPSQPARRPRRRAIHPSHLPAARVRHRELPARTGCPTRVQEVSPNDRIQVRVGDLAVTGTIRD